MNHIGGGQHERLRLVLVKGLTRVRMELAWFSERMSHDLVVHGTCQ